MGGLQFGIVIFSSMPSDHHLNIFFHVTAHNKRYLFWHRAPRGPFFGTTIWSNPGQVLLFWTIIWKYPRWGTALDFYVGADWRGDHYLGPLFGAVWAEDHYLGPLFGAVWAGDQYLGPLFGAARAGDHFLGPLFGAARAGDHYLGPLFGAARAGDQYLGLLFLFLAPNVTQKTTQKY